MSVRSVVVETLDVPLTRPYTIAFQTYDRVQLAVLRVETASGLIGWGSASPAVDVTGETMDACIHGLNAAEEHLLGFDPGVRPEPPAELLPQLSETPAALAAVEMALLDLHGKRRDQPAFRPCMEGLPTSITIGIKDSEAELLAEADEYVGRGFRALKVKIGHDLDEDLHRLRRLRDHVGEAATIRVDANQGYTVQSAGRLLAEARVLGLELVEQPLPAQDLDANRSLPEVDLVCLDESVHDAAQAEVACTAPVACGSINIKLMKGGIHEALRIAGIAERTGRALMWGCMDESRISIAAALQSALSCPATRWLDLDGHLDLRDDPFSGGFTIDAGIMRPIGSPGLGVRRLD